MWPYMLRSERQPPSLPRSSARYSNARELREPLGDLGVAVGGGVLVSHGGTGGGVAEAAHELREGRAGLGCEDRTGVAEVVPAQVVAACRLAGRVGDLCRASRGRHVSCAVRGGREQECVLAGRDVILQMRLHERQQVGRDRDVAHARVRLRRADDHLAVDADDATADLHLVGAQVDVATSQSRIRR